MPGSKNPSRSLWICSWQRSGSTWLAEMLSESSGTRLIYEPANLFDCAFDGVAAAQLALPHEGSAASDVVASALRGTLRGEWVDQLNRAHVVRRRVVKDVRALALAGEVHEMVPDAAVIVLLRHPIAVARSVVELGWTELESHNDGFQREMTRWCEAHVRAFTDPRLFDAYFVDYGTLRSEPHRELANIVSFAARYDTTWRAVQIERIDATRSSSTNFRGSSTASRTEVEWESLSPEQLDFATATLESFGLSGLYGAAPQSKVDVNEFVADFRHTRA